tara:strand:+ start:6401 stop:6577 length:177 start_codon:yes stop_codon:yes gene_type:complete
MCIPASYRTSPYYFVNQRLSGGKIFHAVLDSYNHKEVAYFENRKDAEREAERLNEVNK